MKIFAPALKHKLKACILAVFWPKKSIYKFFKECSVPIPILRSVEKWDAKGLTREAMVDQVFDALSKQPDNGTMHFRMMLELLSEWSHFDRYWFIDQQTLDLDDAKSKINALKQEKTNHIDAARKRAQEHQAKVIAQQERHKSLEEMRQDFREICVNSKTPQARGYAFERFLGRMARYFGLQVTGPFRIKGTQIDGTVKYDGENYTVEAKWEHQLMSDEPLLAFCHKLGINMHGRGIFISVNGFSPGALSMLERSNLKNTVLMDGEDIMLILDEMITLPDALDKKVHAAQTRGQFYIDPFTGRNKIPK